MRRLLSWISLRHLAQHPLRTAVSVLGVALGVAMFVAIRLAGASAVAAFNDSVDALAGRANLQVTGGSAGVDETRLAAVLQDPDVRQAWPAIERLVALPGKEGTSLLVVGRDFYSDPRIAELVGQASGVTRETLLEFLVEPACVAVSATAAGRFGWKPGDRVRISIGGRARTLTVKFLFQGDSLARAYGGDVAVMDIAAAQEVLGAPGRVDRFDIVLREGTSSESATRRISRLVPGADVAPPAARGKRVEAMTASFRMNLLALALVALFVGSFLIFNSVSLSVIQRRRETGILRSVGVSRAQVAGIFLAESAVYGVAGSLLGVVLGVAVSSTALESVGQTVSSLYASVRATRIVLDPATLAAGFLLGVAASLISGLAPALEAACAKPGITVREGSLMQGRRRRLVAVTFAAFVAAGLGAAASAWSLQAGSGALGFAAAGLVLMAAALASPAVTVLLARIVCRPARALWGVEGLVSSRWLAQSLERTAVVIAALGAAVTMLIALNMMVGSFRRTVQVWMDQSVRADVFVEPASRIQTGSYSDLPPAVVDILRWQAGVVAVDALRWNNARVAGRPVDIFAFSLETQRDHSALVFLRGQSREVLDRAVRNGHVLVSETFQNRFGKGTGDSFEVETPLGVRRLTIGGVFYDYTSEQGLIVIHRPLYARLWGDNAVNSAAAYLAPGVDPGEFRRRLQRQFSGFDLTITLNGELKERALGIFDRTFAITNALKIVAVAIAVMGVLTTLAALIIQRQREIGVLRAVGASRAQVARMALIESGLIGLFGSIIGALCGPVLALVLIRVINRLFFGWTIIPTVEPVWFLEAAGWVIGASLIAGIGPARFASRLSPAEAVRQE
ncbi:MAG: ABC transporter permease [Armatimonadota bacterium]